MPGAPAFFHWVDRSGQDHVVDRLEEVPPEYRDKVLKISTAPTEKVVSPPPRMVPHDSVQDPPFDAWHAPSFAVGALSMALVMVATQLLRGMAGRLVVRTVLMGVLVTTLGVVWISVLQAKVRQEAGLPPSLSPTQVVDDAKHIKEQLNTQTRLNEKALKQLDN